MKDFAEAEGALEAEGADQAQGPCEEGRCRRIGVNHRFHSSTTASPTAKEIGSHAGAPEFVGTLSSGEPIPACREARLSWMRSALHVLARRLDELRVVASSDVEQGIVASPKAISG